MKVIRIAFPGNTDGALTHQIRNLGEDLLREIDRQGLGDLARIGRVDQATDALVVTVKQVRLINRVKLIAERVIARHLMTGRASLTTE